MLQFFILHLLLTFPRTQFIDSKHHQMNYCVLIFSIELIAMLSLQDVFVCRSMFYPFCPLLEADNEIKNSNQ